MQTVPVRRLMCAWCHEMNSSTEKYCHNCGHEVGKSRLVCACKKCMKGGYKVVDDALLTLQDCLGLLSWSGRGNDPSQN